MNHPCLVTLERDSAPRTLFSGDQLVEVDLPPGTRCIYPKPPLEPLRDPDAAIRYALNHPLGSDPLHAQLKPGMKVTIAVDDISLPLPPMRRPDVRERLVTILLEMLADHGVEDIEIIVATGVHRRMKPAEIRHMVGDRIFDAYWPDRLYNHDAEDSANIVEDRRDRARRGARAQSPRRRERLAHLRELELRADERRPQIGRRGALQLPEPARAPQPALHPRLGQLHGSRALAARERHRADGPPRARKAQCFHDRDDGEQPHVRSLRSIS